MSFFAKNVIGFSSLIFSSLLYAQEVLTEEPSTVAVQEKEQKTLKIIQNGQTFIVPITYNTAEIVLPSTEKSQKTVTPVLPSESTSTTAPAELVVETPLFSQFGNDILNSKFYIEFKPIDFEFTRTDLKSNDISNGLRVYQEKKDHTKLKVLPTHFRFGFENNDWGNVSEILIDNNGQEGEIAFYRKISLLKIGAGLSLNFEEVSTSVYQHEQNISSTFEKSTTIAPYIYVATTLNEDDFELNLWSKGAVIFNRTTANGESVDIGGAGVQLGFDYYKKISQKLLIGLGGSFGYSYLETDKDADFNLNQFEFGFSLLKTKYNF